MEKATQNEKKEKNICLDLSSHSFSFSHEKSKSPQKKGRIIKMNIQNPVLKGFNPDPSICRVKDDYYIATSTFEWFPGVQIHHSKDLINWRLIAHPLQRRSQLDMTGIPNSGGIWAPCLTHADGKFWLIYTNVKVNQGPWKEGHNYLITCDKIDGEWSEPIYLNSSGFDPSLFHDENGKKYLLNMLWDPRIGINSFAGIALQEYSPTEEKLVGEIKNIFQGTWLKYVEAPHLYQKDGYYYLITAEGATEFYHAVTVARAKKIDELYEIHPDNPILTAAHAPHNYLQKGGHASFVETPNGEWYLAHLTGRPIWPQNRVLLQNRDVFMGRDFATQHIWQNRGYCPLGRESAIQKLEWRNDWPYIVGSKAGSTEVEAPKGITEVKWEPTYPEVDNFIDVKLNLNFATLRIPFSEKLGSLTANPGHLRLYGNESLTSKFTQSFVARRWQSFKFEAETAVAFNPVNVQQGAGLVCYYNTDNWSALQIRWDEKLGRIIELTIGDNFNFMQPLSDKIQIPKTTEYVYFKVNVDTDVYHYSYSFDSKEWTKIEKLLDATKLSDDYVNGPRFTGAFVGMNCDDMSGSRLPADFKYFRYSETSN